MTLNTSSQILTTIAQSILSYDDFKCIRQCNTPDPLQYVPAWHELHAEDQDEAPEYKKKMSTRKVQREFLIKAD